jgi:hypothetical protein
MMTSFSAASDESRFTIQFSYADGIMSKLSVHAYGTDIKALVMGSQAHGDTGLGPNYDPIDAVDQDLSAEFHVFNGKLVLYDPLLEAAAAAADLIQPDSV